MYLVTTILLGALNMPCHLTRDWSFAKPRKLLSQWCRGRAVQMKLDHRNGIVHLWITIPNCNCLHAANPLTVVLAGLHSTMPLNRGTDALFLIPSIYARLANGHTSSLKPSLAFVMSSPLELGYEQYAKGCNSSCTPASSCSWWSI